MQEDQIVGVAGVFVLTFCLIALYHLIGTLGRHSRHHAAQTKQVNGLDQDQQTETETNKSFDTDDAWLRWDPQPDGQADQSRRSRWRLGGEQEHGSKRSAPLR